MQRLYNHYDRALVLDWELVLAFITATQPGIWQDLEKQHDSQVEKRDALDSMLELVGSFIHIENGDQPAKLIFPRYHPTGSGDVRYKGNPQTKTHVVGSGSVSAMAD
ncbi:MAG: hypothetical protein D6675_08400 [Gemmatimonadetes bacterium]|nr:MAG: hypothetical protein D6675_08400 [Gemmatimonadota bacterium]